MKHIYLYTTATYKAKNWYKIGESINKPEKRIKEQDNASNPEPLMLICSWQVPSNINDKKVHKELDALGFLKLRSGREWYELSERPSEDISEILKLLTKDSPVVVKEPVAQIPELVIPQYTEMWWFNPS